MNLYDTIFLILRAYDADSSTFEELCSMLELRGIFMRSHLVRDITAKFSPRPADGDGPIDSIDYTMRGFRIIIQDIDAGVMSQDITNHLKRMNYDWDHDFVCEIIFTYRFWSANGNDNSQ